MMIFFNFKKIEWEEMRSKHHISTWGHKKRKKQSDHTSKVTCDHINGSTCRKLTASGALVSCRGAASLWSIKGTSSRRLHPEALWLIPTSHPTLRLGLSSCYRQLTEKLHNYYFFSPSPFKNFQPFEAINIHTACSNLVTLGCRIKPDRLPGGPKWIH